MSGISGIICGTLTPVKLLEFWLTFGWSQAFFGPWMVIRALRQIENFKFEQKMLCF